MSDSVGKFGRWWRRAPEYDRPKRKGWRHFWTGSIAFEITAEPKTTNPVKH